METCVTLYKPFLLGIYQDCVSLYPDEVSCEHVLGCLNIIELLKPKDIINMCTIGKMIEKSLITGEKLPISDFPTKFSSKELGELFYNKDGFPQILSNCFERLFRRDGEPIYKDFRLFNDQGGLKVQDLENNEREMILELGFIALASDKKAVTQSFALATLCLRQFYLGLSKIRTWECLRRRIYGDTIFQVKNYSSANVDISDLQYSVNCEKTTFGSLLFRRCRLLCTVY